MKKLELKHLAPYLPHNVKQKLLSDGFVDIMTPKHLCNIDYWYNGKYGYRLLLHPLSDLTKPIKVEGYNDGKEFVPVDELFPYGDKKENLADIIENTEQIQYWIIQKLFEWHFAIDLPEGTWIDINTLD